MFKIYIVTNILLWISGIAVGQQEASLPTETQVSQEISYVIPATFAQTLFQHSDVNGLLQVRISKINGNSYLAPVAQSNINPDQTIKTFQNKDEIYSVLNQAKADARKEFPNLFPPKKSDSAKPVRVRPGRTLKAAEKIRSASKIASVGTPETAATQTAAAWNASGQPAAAVSETVAAPRMSAELKRRTIGKTQNTLEDLRQIGEKLEKISFPSYSQNVALDGRIEYLETLGNLTRQLLIRQADLRNSAEDIARSIRVHQDSTDETLIGAIKLKAEILKLFFGGALQLFEGLLYQNETNPTILSESWAAEKSLLHEFWWKTPKSTNEFYDIITSNRADFFTYYWELYPKRMLKKPASSTKEPKN